MKKKSHYTGENPWLIVALIVLVCALISFFLNAGILWLICWVFQGTWWSWRTCLGIWLIEVLLSSVFQSKNGNG